MDKKGSMSINFTTALLLGMLITLVLLVIGGRVAQFLKELHIYMGVTPQIYASTYAIRCAIDSMALNKINAYACVQGVNLHGVKPYPIKSYTDAIYFIQGKIPPDVKTHQTIFHEISLLFSKAIGKTPKSENVIGYAFFYAQTSNPMLILTMPNDVVVVCGNHESLEKSGLTDKEINTYFGEINKDDFRCKVFHVALHQTSPIIGNAPGKPSWGTPDYMIYYEKFPGLEARAWLDKSDSWFVTGLFIGGATAAVPIVGEYLSGILKGSMKWAGEFLADNLMFWSDAEEGTLTGLRKGISAVVKRAAYRNSAEMTDAEAEQIAAEITEGKVTQAMEDMEEHGIPKDEAEEIVSEYSEYGKAPKDSWSTLMQYDTMISELFTDDGKWLGLSSDTETSKLFSQLSLDVAENPSDFNKDVNILSKYLSGSEITFDGETYQIPPSEKATIRDFVKNNLFKRLKSYGLSYEMLPENGKKLFDGRVSEAVTTYVKNSRSFRLMLIDALSSSGLLNQFQPGSVDLNGDGKPDLDLLKKPVMKCVAATPTIKGKAACMVLSLIGFGVLYSESHFYNKPIGINDIGVYYPWLIFSSGRVKGISLIPEAMPYYIKLDRTGSGFSINVENPRFYLVSPCYTDLVLYKKMDWCSIPRCDKYYDMVASGTLEMLSPIYWLYGIITGGSTLAQQYGCLKDGTCDITNKDVYTPKGFCYCIFDPLNPCYNKEKCNEWIEKYLKCFPYDGMWVLYPPYKFKNKIGVKATYLVKDVDVKKYPDFNNPPENMPGVKVCMPWNLFGTNYQVPTIFIKPLLYNNIDRNYCYWGKGDFMYQVKKTVLNGVFLVVDLFLSECPPALVASGMAYAYLDNAIDSQYLYPNNPSAVRIDSSKYMGGSPTLSDYAS